MLPYSIVRVLCSARMQCVRCELCIGPMTRSNVFDVHVLRWRRLRSRHGLWMIAASRGRAGPGAGITTGITAGANRGRKSRNMQLLLSQSQTFDSTLTRTTNNIQQNETVQN